MSASDLGGPGTINYIEILGESRGFQISRKSVSKQFVFIVQSERFVDEAPIYPLPGTNADMYFDDILVQKDVIRVFWSVIPMVYVFWINDVQAILLFANDMNVRQLNWSTWRIEVTYDIPDDNGSNTQTGQGGGETGPSNGEQNSQKYTQVSFNGSVGSQTIQTARLLEVQKSLSLPAGETVPYTAGEVVPIGVSEEEVSGAEVYKREFRFQITQYLPPSRVTYSFVRKLSRMITCINSNPFFGFAPGSVMFVGYSGESDLYEAVPITLEFEVRTNFKFLPITTSVPAPPEDRFTFPGGVPTVDYTPQFDRIADPDFPASAIPSWGGMDTGVHSGWSIVSYLYLKEIKVNSAAGVIRKPSHRLVYEHYQYQNFDFFLL